ncbi:MAG: [protein-PII] uridylyltransferase [Verrucomicrobiota bacterium]
MPAHLEKVLRHAAQKLSKAAELDPQASLDVYRDFLKLEEHRLYLAHNAGEGGLSFSQKRAEMLDVVLRHIWQAALKPLDASKNKHALALVAVGGYGRKELCPYSDVDLLFLSAHSLQDSPTAQLLTSVVERMLYVLWDMDFKVGHATRTLDEVVEQGNADLRTKTALLEARLIAGSEKFYEEFQRRFRKFCITGQEKDYLQWRLKDQDERHRKYGNSVFVQEPNIKNSCGGLRDYQNLLWAARVCHGLNSTEALMQHGHLAKAERKHLDQAYNFLLRIRNEIHFQQKRADDILTLRMQGQVADAFGYAQKNILRRIEAFMRDYYQAANTLYQMDSLLARRFSENERRSQKHFLDFFRFKKERPIPIDGMTIRGKKLYVDSKGGLSDPAKILRVFQVMQQRHLELSAELETALRHKQNAVHRRAYWSPEVREMLLNILRKKGEVGRVLRMLHRVELMGKFIPEFEPLTCLVQHEFFHVYTADEHTLICLEQLDKVVDCAEEPFPKYRDLFLRCDYPEVIYLALILHDAGKINNLPHHNEASAQLAAKMARRLRIKGRPLQNLLFLVYHHGTLSEFAQRRNLEEPETIREFARIVQDEERLDMLMLMTFTDAHATSGGTNWSSWKELLIWNLYYQTKQMLQGEEEFLKKLELKREEIRKQVRQLVPRAIGDDELAAHFTLLPKAYFHSTSEALIARHIERVRDFLMRSLSADQEALKPLVEWIDRPSEGHSEVIVVTWDRAQLFSKIAGSFAMAELNILSADVFTREDHIVVDTFRVCTPRYEAVTHQVDRRVFEETLTRCLTNEAFDLRKALRQKQAAARVMIEGAEFPTWIQVDNDTSSRYTLIHVRTPDRIGLLFEITSCLSHFDLVIFHSRITTEKGAALDTFYVSPPQGGKILDAEIQEKLLHALQTAVAPK